MIALLLPVLLAQLPVISQMAPQPPATSAVQGRAPYLQYCATCHGTDLRGGLNAPSLRGVGAAVVDFMLSTGRMPAAVPWVEVGHRGPQFSQATIDAIVAYVSSVQPGGLPIPTVVTGGNVDHGRELFRENCMHCHGADARGGAIGGREWAPDLDRATVTQIAEAIRVGPGEMPTFGERQLPQNDLNDIATYLSQARATAEPFDLPARSSGPVPEGLLGWIGAGLMLLFAGVFSASAQRRKP
jgi:ubiquinol-cytochrome c reductase cytochrome c subunit